MTDTAKPVVPEVLDLSGDAAALTGSRCVGCGAVYYPKAAGCRNPECDSDALEPELIVGDGVLHSFTVQRYQPPSLFGMDPWSPYAIALVDMSQGVRVMGIVAGGHMQDLRIGMRLSLASQVIAQNGDQPVATHMFVPADDSS